MAIAPSLFISHGAPTFALEPGLLGANLGTIASRLPDLRGVLVVSAHWQSRGVRVMTTAAPETVHDFGGFPRELYRLQYPAPGAPEAALEAGRLLADQGFAVAEDAQRGLDHGAWVPMLHLFPDARVPTFQVSMPYDLDTASAWRLGRALGPLRDSGILIIGSGSLTHNLYEVRQDASDGAPYAREFAGWVRDAVLARDTDRLIRYRRNAPHAERAHPSEEHYLPLLVALGASAAGSDMPEVIEGGMTYEVLSMESYAWGMPEGVRE
ncbi:MAG: Aromatic ring-opening dioxygenase LigB [Gammaproteobacteria bacterium]|jgi:4,5-DOPA dioxygenase extradiol|nr:Aromatic ring-opening dioxygenase LigB [Gammaproteobacteria bacterium]